MAVAKKKKTASKKKAKKIAKKTVKKSTAKKKLSLRKPATKKVKKKATKKVKKKKVIKKARVAKKSKKAASKKPNQPALRRKKVLKKKVVIRTSKSTSGVGEGDLAPSLKLQATSGIEFDLRSFRSDYLVLFFYPKDNTPGCTLEGHDFSRLAPQFFVEKTDVFGVSKDSLASHEKFKTKQAYSIDLISDEKSGLSEAFGVFKEKNMYGRQFMGIERSTFVIKKGGKIVKEWRKVKVPGHAAEVLDFIRSLKA